MIFRLVLTHITSVAGVQAVGLVGYLPLSKNRSWGSSFPAVQVGPSIGCTTDITSWLAFGQRTGASNSIRGIASFTHGEASL